MRGFRREGAGEAAGPIVARIDRADQQQQREGDAQRERIAAQEPGFGRADFELPRRCGHALLMCAPQRGGAGIVAAAGELVLDGGEGAVVEAACQFEAAPRIVAARPGKAPHAVEHGERQQHQRGRQEQPMAPGGQPRRNVEEREREENADHDHARPQRRPQPLPHQRHGREIEAALEARRRGGRNSGVDAHATITAMSLPGPNLVAAEAGRINSR